MTFLMREQPELGPANAVALFEIVETNEEQAALVLKNAAMLLADLSTQH